MFCLFHIRRWLKRVGIDRIQFFVYPAYLLTSVTRISWVQAKRPIHISCEEGAQQVVVGFVIYLVADGIL